MQIIFYANSITSDLKSLPLFLETKCFQNKIVPGGDGQASPFKC